MSNDGNERRPDSVEVDFELNGYDAPLSEDDGVEARPPGAAAEWSGMGELGASQSTLNRVSAVQNELAVRLAEVNAVGAAEWDALWAKMQGKTIPGSSIYFYGYEFVRSELIKTVSKMLVTASYTPSDAAIGGAEAMARDVGVMVAYFKSLAPARAAEIAAEAERCEKHAEARTVIPAKETAND